MLAGAAAAAASLPATVREARARPVAVQIAWLATACELCLILHATSRFLVCSR